MSDIRVEYDVTAVAVGGRDLNVDIFHPGDNANGGCLLFLPGGGFRTANKAGLHERYAPRIAERGYVFIATEYRVMDEAMWPAQIQDAKALIRWTHANAERLGIDPDRIVLGGASAGGNLSTLAGGTQGNPYYEGDGGNEGVSSDVAAIIGVYPVTDVTERAYGEAVSSSTASTPAPSSSAPPAPSTRSTPTTRRRSSSTARATTRSPTPTPPPCSMRWRPSASPSSFTSTPSRSTSSTASLPSPSPSRRSWRSSWTVMSLRRCPRRAPAPFALREIEACPELRRRGSPWARRRA